MAEKQKPEYDIVKKAAQAFKDPKLATPTDIKRFASLNVIKQWHAQHSDGVRVARVSGNPPAS